MSALEIVALAAAAAAAGWWLGARVRGSMAWAAVDALVQAFPDGLMLTNLRGDILYANRPALGILGVTGPVAGRPLAEAIGSQEMRMKIQDILKRRTQSEVLDLPVRGQRGASRSAFRTSVHIWATPAGRAFGVMLLLREIAEKS